MDEMTKKLIELYEQNIALLKENNELKLKLANNSTAQININPLGQLPLIGTINTPYVYSPAASPGIINTDSFKGNLLLTSDDIKHLRNGIPHVG